MLGKIKKRGQKMFCIIDQTVFLDMGALAKLYRFRAGDLADILEVSERHMERAFHSEVGMSPKKWLREQRMKYVLELFARGLHKRVVAEVTGFKSYSHFASEVSKSMGLCPKELEKLEKGD